MKTRRSFAVILPLSFSLWFFAGCTESPISDNKVAGGTRQIRGTLRLDDGKSPEGIYVWLDGYHLGVHTDAAGRFQLSLPSSGQTGGLSGIFKLYSYVANYRLGVSEVVVADDEFVYNKSDINKDGELARTVFLSKYLRIVTEVNPSSVRQPANSRLFVTVNLETIGADTVTVVFPGLFTDGLAKALLRNINTNQALLLYSTSFGFVTSDFHVVGVRPLRPTIIFDLNGLSIPPGDYEVIPYILLKHEKIPPQLLPTLGTNLEAFTAEYLKIPFRREGGRVTVTN
jgi:hypothetical protein